MAVGSENKRVSIYQELVAEASSSTLKETPSVLTKDVSKESADTILPKTAYNLKPKLDDRFKAEPIKQIIQSVLSEHLVGHAYDSDRAKKWTIHIANEVNEKIRELKMKRYKHIVQVTIGELKGAGVKSGVRCLWDSETDGYTSDIFMNDTIFAVVVVFGIYLY